MLRPGRRHVMYERISCGSSSISASLVKDLGELRGDSWMVATVLPEQFHNTASSLSQGRPEAALMQAVLEDAVGCVRFGLRATDRRKQRFARGAEGWPLCAGTDWPISFFYT